MQDPRVESVREFYIYRDRQNRYVEVNFTVFDKDENRLYMSEVVDFE